MLAGAAVGPFYCPADEKLYLDLGVGYVFGDHVQARFNVANVFDTDPPLMASAVFSNNTDERTYDIFAGYWPHNQDIPIGARFQRINKYVLTHSDEPLTWTGSHRLSGDTAEIVAELKRSEGRDLLIQGSSTLYPPLLRAGLIDRLILMTFPVVLGAGKRIFDGSERAGALELVDHFVSDKGVIIATYRPAGDVSVGSFETRPPSEEKYWRQVLATACRANTRPAQRTALMVAADK